MLLTMPGGWSMSQIEPAQPATTYAEFKKEILNEIARRTMLLEWQMRVVRRRSTGVFQRSDISTARAVKS